MIPGAQVHSVAPSVHGPSSAPRPIRLLPAAYRAQSDCSRVRPLQPGCNIGFHLTDAGTGSICCFVQGLKPEDAGLRLLLSCEHVLCNNLRRRHELFDLVPLLSGTIEQPGPKYQTDQAPPFAIGAVHRAGGVQFGGHPNRIDAAVAALSPDIATHSFTLGYNLPITGISPPAAGMQIIKVGSATGTEVGVIPYDFLVDAWVDYGTETDDSPSRSAFFTQVVRYRCRCADGDSGAPVLNAHTYELVGLHFAGTGDEGLFCPIETVFAELALTL
jgi:hypothetical protein